MVKDTQEPPNDIIGYAVWRHRRINEIKALNKGAMPCDTCPMRVSNFSLGIFDCNLFKGQCEDVITTECPFG